MTEVATVWCREIYSSVVMMESGELGFDLNFVKFWRDESLFIGLFVLNSRRGGLESHESVKILC
jgi:hypothetical protein